MLEASLHVADHVEDSLFNAFDELVRLPWIGHHHNDVDDPSLLFYNVFDYAIVFRREPRVVVVRIVHGARNMARMF